jgi:hypothetical protein
MWKNSLIYIAYIYVEKMHVEKEKICVKLICFINFSDVKNLINNISTITLGSKYL